MRNSRSALFLCGIALCFQTAIFGQDSDWTQINSGTIKHLYDVEFVDNATGWIVGTSGTILKSTDGGSTWSNQTSGTTRDLFKLHILNPDTAFAVGATGTFLYTVDGGNTWTRNDIPSARDIWDIKTSSFWSKNMIFMVGEDHGTLYQSTKQNETWESSSWNNYTSGRSTTSPTERLYAIDMTDNNLLLMAGHWGLIFKDKIDLIGAPPWEISFDLDYLTGELDRFYDVKIIDDENFIVVGEKVIARSTDAGANWSYSEVNYSLREINFIDSQIGFIGGMGTTAGSFSPVLKTTDGGATWTAELITTDYGMGIHMFDKESGIFVGFNGAIWKRTDTTAPTVTSVSSTATDSTYGIGSVIPITVTFSESVTVTGTPQLTLLTGTTDTGGTTEAVVDYSSGSESTILTFNYTVANGHNISDLEYIHRDALALNSGTIKDLSGNAATLTLTLPGQSGSLGANKAIVIDGIVPAIVSTTFTSPAANEHLTVTFSEGIYNTNGGSGGVEKEDFNITLTQNNGTVTAASISSIIKNAAGALPIGGETTIYFTLDLTGTASGVESIMITPKSASVYDIAGNDASTIAQGNNSVVLKDQTAPTISSVSLASDNSTMAVTFSEAVYNTNSGSGALEANDFSLGLSNSTNGGTTGVLSSNTPSSISADGNIYTLGISFTTPSKGGDTLYVRYYDDSIYDAAGNEIAKDIVGMQVGVNYFAITNDVVPPVISSTAPNQNSYVNHTKVSYTLDDAAASGTITWTRTGGSEDSNSPHAKALAGDELNTGAHTDITLTNNPTLVDGAIYTISFDAKDLGGNAATTVSVTNITYDVSAPNISSTLPVASSYVNHARVSYTLSEAISSGTVTWTRTGGSEDTNSPYAKALTGDELNTGAHTDITLNNSPTLIDGAIYTVSFGATDLAGNSATTVSSTGITYDVTAPTISSTTPSQSSYINNTKVSYTLSESAASGTITWARTGGSADSNSPHAKSLAGTELNSGAHTDITLTNSPTLVDAMYTVSFDAIDVAGNAATTVSASNVTYDFTAPTLLKVTPAADSFLPIADNSKIRIDFSEPITAYNVDASSKLGANINTSIQQDSDSLVISVNAPLTSLDTLTFKVTNLTDRGGTVGDDIEISYQTSILADYNNDYKVDVQDLANFVSLWPDLDLGPAKGTIPYLTPEMDGLANLRDVGIFTRMWHWSYANNGASSKVFTSIGEPITINHSSDRIIVPIPDNAIAGEILLQYQETDIDLGLSDEVTENRMVISNRDAVQGLLAVNFGYMKQMQNKELGFSVQHKGTSNSDFTISYVYYDENNTIVNMGTQDFDLKAIPLEFALHENYPNPFNPTTTLRFDLPEVSDITLTIYNMLGQRVKTFNMQGTPAGYHTITWNATNDLGQQVGAGVYLYQLQTNNFVKTRKMVLLK